MTAGTEQLIKSGIDLALHEGISVFDTEKLLEYVSEYLKKKANKVIAINYISQCQERYKLQKQAIAAQSRGMKKRAFVRQGKKEKFSKAGAKCQKTLKKSF